jgi:hypothetical protein
MAFHALRWFSVSQVLGERYRPNICAYPISAQRPSLMIRSAFGAISLFGEKLTSGNGIGGISAALSSSRADFYFLTLAVWSSSMPRMAHKKLPSRR